MSSELKPCPFCGSKADLEITSLFEGDTSFVVSCTGCGCELLARHNATEQEAIDAWNQRAERTCTAHQELLSDHMENCIVRFSCGHKIFGLADEYHYCPNCGAKVVD